MLGPSQLASSTPSKSFPNQIEREHLKFEEVENLRREVLIHKELNHPNIIKLYNFFESQRHIYLILEYIPGGNLYDFMKLKSMDDQQILKIFKDIMRAVLFLHSKKIFHRDIKPENVLIDSQKNFKLCDFGFSALFDNGENRQTLCGTKEYLAPEVISSDYQSDKVDIWCMGVLLYELIHKRPPFNARNIVQMLDEIKLRKFTFRQNINQDFKRIIDWCLQLEPENRPTAAKLFESFAILRDNNGNTFSETQVPTSDSYFINHRLDFKKVPEKNNNVNINIGSFNINIVNNTVTNPKWEKKPETKSDYVNVYSNINPNQQIEKFSPVEQKSNKIFKYSIPDKLLHNEPKSYISPYLGQGSPVKQETEPNRDENNKNVPKFYRTQTWIANTTPLDNQGYNFATRQSYEVPRSVNSMVLLQTKPIFEGQSTQKHESLQGNYQKQPLFDNIGKQVYEQPRVNPKVSPFESREPQNVINYGSNNYQNQQTAKIDNDKRIYNYSPAQKTDNFFDFSTQAQPKLIKFSENFQNPLHFKQEKLSLNSQNQPQLQLQKTSSFTENQNQINPFQLPQNQNMGVQKNQNSLSTNTQIVNIYKKDFSDPTVNPPNIYKNMTPGYYGSPKIVDQRNNTPTQQTFRPNQTPSSINQTMYSNKLYMLQGYNPPKTVQNVQQKPQTSTKSNEGVFIGSSSIDRRNYTSYSVPRQIEMVQINQINQQNNNNVRYLQSPVQNKPEIVSPQQSFTVTRSRPVRSASAQIGEVHSVRYINFN